MIYLTRQARLFLPSSKTNAHSNRWSSLTTVEPLRPFLVFDVTVSGQPCPVSGYIVNIRRIDQWVQEAISAIELPAESGYDRWNIFSSMVICFHHQLNELIQHNKVPTTKDNSNGQPTLPSPTLVKTEVRLSPYLWLTASIDSDSDLPQAAEMPKKTSTHLQLTQQFEFSAAHRLNCDQWSLQQNLEAFGKCNHPNGHGHNYLLDVTIERTNESPEFVAADVSALETSVNQAVIEKLDHRFLNLDVAEFQQMNPTVENISQVVFGWLKNSLPLHLNLVRVRVYETAKTWAEATGD